MSEELLLQEFPPHDLDKLCYEPPSPSNDGSSQDYLLFFISGNPGLISFYEPFLSELHSLRSSSTSPRFHICGHSFRGFELSPQNQSSGGPFSLEDQINFQNDLLYEHIKEHTRTVGKPPKVILMGHSVGAYVLLELIRRHKEFIDQNEDQDDVDLIGAILIFPTVQDIAKSPLGRVARVSFCMKDAEDESNENRTVHSASSGLLSYHGRHRQGTWSCGAAECSEKLY